ncbi:alanine racemase [Nadsonia fulvescens var. elongata DSM 6958]|uniref:Pyridoxal phosphate homeostasis protein n=1 Tax=Nadsonia fulvescens var. elongata DSM 6958 TaxID=857566 RepID=A0A1E3PFN8_9ASCO|nr:alanine racemase [Nadsonia fulvescens var. elongata DSM 6958]
MSTSLTSTPERAASLIERINSVKSNIQELGAASRTRLVAVSKFKQASDIQTLYDQGQRHFGENYMQELTEKANLLPKDICWHFIGGLQSNKCKDLAAIENIWAVETIDSEKKAKKLDVARAGKSKINVFIQVNTSGEDQKSGLNPGAETVKLAKFIELECPNLTLAGLMTIGSLKNSASNEENQDFKKLTEAKSLVESELGLSELELSIGMSSDYKEAIRQGSTNIRVGSYIFGAR